MQAPVFRAATYRAWAGVSLPAHANHNAPDPDAALHLARHGDVEAALKLADDATRPEAEGLRLGKNYPVEWTRLVSLTLGLILVTALHPGVGLNLPLPAATAGSGVETAAFNLKDFVSHLVPASIVEALTAADDGREHRQIHMIDARGRIGAYTGAACIDWCGQTSGASYSVAGNMLAGRDVIAATAKAYESESSRPFAERLIAALAAGERAGGDKRGKQAAALLIATTEDYPALDLRVDDHAEPIVELARLYEKSAERFQPFVGCLPSRRTPAGIFDRVAIETEIARFQSARRKG